MLYTYSNTDQTVAVNGVVALGNNGVSTCGCISHAAGTGSVSLQRAGYYQYHTTIVFLWHRVCGSRSEADE